MAGMPGAHQRPSGIVRPSPVVLIDNEHVRMTLLRRTLQMGIVGRKAGMIERGSLVRRPVGRHRVGKNAAPREWPYAIHLDHFQGRIGGDGGHALTRREWGLAVQMQDDASISIIALLA